MAVYKCYDCNIRLCKECSRKHNDENKYQRHVMQYISDSFILNCKFSVEDDLPGESFIRDIKCLPNGMVIVAVYRPLSTVLVCSISGEQRQIKQLKSHPQKMDVMDKTTVAVLLENNSMAIIDTQQFIVQYIRHNDTCRNVRSSFICIEKLFYFADKIGIKVVDSSGTEQRGIKLSFTPYDMCYDVHSQRIYCIDYDNRKLTCIDRDGNIIFTFSDTNVKNLHRITIDNDGNVLVLCIKRGDSLDCVIKVNSNGKLSEVVITNIAMPDMFSCIGFHHLTNSVVIGVDTDVYIYKEDKKSLNIG